MTLSTYRSAAIDPRVARLAQEIHFTAADLEANRAGALSEAQLARCAGDTWRTMVLVIAVGFGIACAACIVIAATLPKEERYLILAGIAGGAVFALACVLAGVVRRGDREEAKKGPATVVGAVRKLVYVPSVGSSMTPIHYLILPNDERLVVTPSLLDAFEDGVEYHVHYVRNTARLLSVEAIENRRTS